MTLLTILNNTLKEKDNEHKKYLAQQSSAIIDMQSQNEALRTRHNELQ